MRISIFLNIIFIVSIAELSSLAFKNIDKEAGNLIKLNACENVTKYQDKMLRSVWVKQIIYED